jgi:hypothetical protein
VSLLSAQTIAVNVGATPQIFVVPGTTVNIPVEANLTGAGSTNIASLSTGFAWNTLSGGFPFSSLVVGPTGWSFSSNTAGAAAGSVSLTTSNGAQLPATSTLATISFTPTTGTPGVQRGTRLFLAPTAAANAAAASILTLLRPRILDVCIADESDGKWGDINDDNAVNINDAQQIARFGIGLSLSAANLNGVLNRGDVNNDGLVNINDAQQAARFGIGLTTTTRVGTATFTAPAVATHNLTPSTTQSIAVGATLQITNTPRTAGAVDLTGCAGSTWNSSNPAVATVNASGLVSGVAGGSTTITSTSTVNGAVTAQLTVNVTGGATQLVVTQTPAGAVSGAAFTTQPVVEIRDATNALVSSATNQVTATLTSGTGAIIGTASVNAAGGVATFAGLRIDLAGAKTLTFSSTGLTSTTANFSVTAGALASITVALSPVSPLALNASTTASANGFDAAGNPLGAVASPVWSTNTVRVARVTSAGAVQGIGSGNASIIATSGAISGQTALTVNAAAANFAITMENITDLTSMPTVQAAFTAAANKWATVIRGDAPGYNGGALDVASCSGVPGKVSPTSIDDIYIYVTIAPIDGAGGTLGSAGPCYIVGSGAAAMPIIGRMTFDVVDIGNLTTEQLNAVILHEMGHVLGIGTLWQTKGLASGQAPTDPNPMFTGINGKWAFDNLGTGYVGGSVPIENCTGIPGCGAGTINGHWRELIIPRELMTGYIQSAGVAMPLSMVTGAALIDMNYVADVSMTDLYSAPFLRTFMPSVGELVPIREAPMPPPINVDATGRRIAPARADSASVRRH